MRREFRVTLKKDIFHFRIIEGRKKIFERFYKKEDVKTIMSARIKGEIEFHFEGLTEEEKKAAVKTLRGYLFENKITEDRKMNREEAYKAMMEGNYITHDSFSENEYLKMVNSAILDEKNYDFQLGWETRNTSEWENGWSIKKKEKKK